MTVPKRHAESVGCLARGARRRAAPRGAGGAALEWAARLPPSNFSPMLPGSCAAGLPARQLQPTF